MLTTFPAHGYVVVEGALTQQVIYYRLQASGHRDRWREVVTNPLAEFRAG
ncbi:MAG TPA: hypothetical protein VGI58_11020 [Streptosporangiaceae bacterium]